MNRLAGRRRGGRSFDSRFGGKELVLDQGVEMLLRAYRRWARRCLQFGYTNGSEMNAARKRS